MQQSQDFNILIDNKDNIENIQLIDNICDYYQEDLRGHQIEALQFMNERNNGIIQCFCGTGKSRIIYEKTIQVGDGNILLVFPSLALVQQFYEQYLKKLINVEENDNDFHSNSIISSDQLNTTEESKINTMDEKYQAEPQIIICDSKHTKKINEDHFSSDLNIFLTTYQSLAKFKQYFDYFNLVIFDEAHHIATQRIINLIQQIENADIFYFTATPKVAKNLLNMYQSQDEQEILDKQEETKQNQQTIHDEKITNESTHKSTFTENIDQNMNNENIINGNMITQDDNKNKNKKDVKKPEIILNPIDCGEIFVYDFNQALEDGYVVDYELHHCIYQPTKDIINDQFNALIEFAKIHKRTRIISFNQFIDKETEKKTNSHSFIQFQSEFVQIKIVSAKTKPAIRESIFKWFQEEDYGITKIIFNAACVKEGIDLPCCDLIVFCDDKQSPINIIQCIGRATRLSNNKKTAMITAMIPLDLEQTQFKIVTNICKALKNVDFRMKQIFDQKALRQITKFSATNQINENQAIQYSQFTDKIIEKLQFLNTFTWMQRYEQLKQFVSINQKLPSSVIKQQKSLYYWVSDQKDAKRKEKLQLYQIQLLEQINGWKWVHDSFQFWLQSYQQVKQIIEQTGHYPKLGISSQQNKLTSWVRTQRNVKRGTASGQMTDQKQIYLNQLPNWKWNLMEEQWQEKYQNLKNYIAQYDKYPPYDNGKNTLDCWIKIQQYDYRLKKISQIRQQALEQLPNWKWRQLREQQKLCWDTKYSMLVQFLNENNNKYPNTWSLNITEKQIGQFVSDQRQRQNTMCQEYVQLLEKLPNWKWRVNEESWQTNYNLLKEYVSAHNKTPPGKSGLGSWVHHQKMAKKGKGGIMDEERIQLLEQIPGWIWGDVLQNNWNKNYENVKQFLYLNDGVYPTKQDNKPLSEWVNQQKKDYNKKQKYLTGDRIQKLECLKNWELFSQINQKIIHIPEKIIKLQIEIVWDGKFKMLKDYLSKNNNNYPSSSSQNKNDRSLGYWIITQRKNYLKKEIFLTQQRIYQLEQLQGWQWIVKEDVWLNRYQEIQQFLINSDGKYPRAWIEIEKSERVLGQWVQTQRTNYRKKEECLTVERINLLEQLQGWQWIPDEKWRTSYDQLKYYLEKNNYIYPKNGAEDQQGNYLAGFIQKQRYDYKKQQKRLTEEKINLLEQLKDFKWQEEDSWPNNYNQLSQFLQKNNNIYPNKRSQNKKEQHFGRWVAWQRQQFKNGKLTENQEQQLEQLPSWKWSKQNENQNIILKKSKIKIYSQSVITQTHQIAFTSISQTLFTRFKSDQQQLINYHQQRELKQKKYQQCELPHNIISQKLKEIKNKSKVQIIDLGCGMNKVAEGLKDDSRFEFTSIDFQVLPNSFGNVQQGNIADLAHIEEFTFKYAIMSLCFWGVDFEKSIQECFRILEDPGVLYIIQTKKKMEGFEQILRNAGFNKKDEQIIGKYYYLEYRK